MKLSVVYKSKRKADTYLYVEKKNAFDRVPEVLLKQFGPPVFVMYLAIEKHKKVAGIDSQSFVTSIKDKGYYLQMPPAQKNLLKTHRSELGLDANIPTRERDE
ncbi:YcgL domain-containing protein [Glaciecola petra]|uniref:YcgL domain-containing protein RM552_03680 n=1 Tax=Glaciecola petra TaxID=3075602 RepID=A0ABU2ZMU2_9ALTE|nr:YcgL domain-containing protein [Aestuariibacter sp. P117]MDT0593940.1 YcgL domain-containing protein [Aestuariibacter sp. P117]